MGIHDQSSEIKFSLHRYKVNISKMNLLLATLLLLTVSLNGCFCVVSFEWNGSSWIKTIKNPPRAKPVSCPRDDNNIEMSGGYSIDGTNRCRCYKGQHGCTRMMPARWEDGSVRCRRDYYVDPCNICQCVEQRGQCTHKDCPYSFQN